MPRENDPDYVRLSKRMSRGIVADIGKSGWSISGLDVKPFPEDDDVDEQKYVRRLVNNGTLEPCSKAEYEEVHPEASEDADSDNDGEAFVRAVETVLSGGRRKNGIQEAQVQKRIQRDHARLAAKRDEAEDSEDDEDDGEFITESPSERRARLIEAQKEAGLDTDDPEEQVAAKRGTAVKPKSAKAKKAAKKAAPSEE